MLKLLEKEGCGAHLNFKTVDTRLEVKTLDRTGKEMMIEISDVEYPFMPRITRTESF
jgi:hypothetical protein